MIRDAKARLDALRKLLQSGELSTQEELREKLEKLDFAVTQSTVSRDLRKLGAVRGFDARKQAVYRLAEGGGETSANPGSLAEMVRTVKSNGSLIVIHTVVGSAPLIARHLDRINPPEILGTIAGDDTIFVAPALGSPKAIDAAIAAVRKAIG